MTDRLLPDALDGEQVQRRLTDIGAVEFSAYRSATGYRVVVPGIATFTIDRDANVAIQTDGSSTDAIEAYFRYRIAPLLGQLRGKPCLHGGAVVANGAAVAFLGNSGAGKSTLVASFDARSPVLGDDCVIVELPDDGAVACPVDACVRLRDDSLAGLAAGAPSSPSFGKEAVRLRHAEKPARLARIYLLETADNVSIERLGKRDALVRLASHAYRLDPTNARLLEQEMAFFEAIATRVVVAKLKYPRSFDALPHVQAAILSDLGEG